MPWNDLAGKPLSPSTSFFSMLVEEAFYFLIFVVVVVGLRLPDLCNGILKGEKLPPGIVGVGKDKAISNFYWGSKNLGSFQ